jgi:hypothetical protein
MEAARRAHEEREHWKVDDQQRRKEEEYAHQEVTAQREVEEQKEAEAWKVEAEQRECLAQDKAAWEAAAAEE